MNRSAKPGSPARWGMFIAAMIIGIVLITAGICLIFADVSVIPPAAVFGVSLLMLAASLWVLGPLPSKNWPVSIGLLAIGTYGMARGVGAIRLPWLAHLIGFACIAAAGLLLYIAQPGQKTE